MVVLAVVVIVKLFVSRYLFFYGLFNYVSSSGRVSSVIMVRFIGE
jgi:hypothetical protein